jgi:hypothetical protein
MNDDRAETIEIIEQQGSFLLIRVGPRFAVVEKRAGRVYPMKPGEREGEPLTPEGLAAAMADEGWLSEVSIRAPMRGRRPGCNTRADNDKSWLMCEPAGVRLARGAMSRRLRS